MDFKNNRMDKILKLLGLEANEEFTVKGRQGTFRIGSTYLEEYHEESGEWIPVGNNLLNRILNGLMEYKRLDTWPPRQGSIVYFWNMPFGVVDKMEFQAGDPAHLAMYKAGLLFRTRREAEVTGSRLSDTYKKEIESAHERIGYHREGPGLFDGLNDESGDIEGKPFDLDEYFEKFEPFEDGNNKEVTEK